MKIINERETQRNQRQKITRGGGGAEAIVKGRELNDFAVGLS